MNYFIFKILSGVVLMAALQPATALAELMLYPTRVELEKNARSAQVELINRGQTPETYRISIVNRRMTESGQIVDATQALPGEAFAIDMLRYSPRQVTLKGGESQTVRISLRKPADLAPGEYRSHLQFDRLPDPDGSADLRQAVVPGEGQLSIKLTALVGASIPIIVRHGETTAAVTLDGLRIETGVASAAHAAQSVLLIFNLNRSGNRSIYGNLIATYQPAGGIPVEVGAVNGVAVYVPNTTRQAKLPLQLPLGMALQGGQINLKFLQRIEHGGKPMAQASLPVP